MAIDILAASGYASATDLLTRNGCLPLPENHDPEQGTSIEEHPNGALALRMGGKIVAVLDADNNLAEVFLDNPENPNPSSDESEDV